MADLDFTINADTKAAQAQISRLEKSLSNLIKVTKGLNTAAKVDINTSAALTKITALETKIKGLQTAMTNLSKNTAININTANATGSLDKLSSSSKNTTTSLDALKGAVVGLAIGSAVNSVIQYADGIKDLSTATGISTETLIGFGKAVQANGGDSAKAGDAILKLVNNIQEAADGSKEMQDAFAKVGVSLNDLGSLTEEQILGKVLRGLQNVGSASEQVALKNQLLGKSFRGVSTANLADDLEKAAAASRRYATAIDAAAKTQDVLDAGLSQLKLKILENIEPITRFIGSLDDTQIERATTTISNLGVAIGGIAIAATVSGALAILAGVLAPLGAVGASVAAALTALGAAVVALAAKFGILTVAWEAFKAVTPESWSKGLQDGWTNLTKKVQDYLSVTEQANKTNETLARANVKPNASGGRSVMPGQPLADPNQPGVQTVSPSKSMERQLELQRRVSDAIEKEAQGIRKLASDYGRLNEVNNARYKLETSLIGQSEAARSKAQMRFDAEQKYQEEMLKLQEQIDAKKKSGSESDLRLVKELEAAQANLTKAYTEQKSAIDAMVASREAATRAENLSKFTSDQMAETQRKLRDLERERASVGLPEYKKALVDIKYALDDAAEAAIKEEEARRGAKLDPSERKAYYDAARKGLDDLTAAQERLNQATEKHQQMMALQSFQNKEMLDTQKKIREVQDDMAKSTMTDIERKYYDIKRAADENARSAIEAENARRKQSGAAVLTAQEEEQYYKAAREQSDKLLEAQRQATEHSRKFSTGWERSYKQYIEDAGNAAATAERVFKTATQGMEDAIVNFAKTGKFEWKSFVSSLAEELLRSEIKSIFADLMSWMTGKTTETTSIIGKAFGSIFGGAGGQAGTQQGGGILSGIGDALGGLFGGGTPRQQGGQQSGGGLGDILSGIGNIFGGSRNSTTSGGGIGGGGILSGIGDLFDGWFANGGQIGAGRFGVVGERGPELVSGPATVTPMQPTSVVYNINAVDAPSFKALVAQDPSFIYAVTMAGAKSIPGGR